MMAHTTPPRDKQPLPEPEVCPRCKKSWDDHDYFDRPGGKPLAKPECRKEER